MSDAEISEFLQRQCGQFTRDHSRLVVTLSTAARGYPATALIEVEGTPPRGMAIVRISIGNFSNAMPVGSATVWVMKSPTQLRKLPDGENARAIVKLCEREAKSKFP